MASWRGHPTDAWAEAERLEVKTICQNLGWSRRRLTKELDSSASPDTFIGRVTRALKELDKPRLLHRDPAMPPTSNSAVAVRERAGEPAEMVPQWFENDLAKENNAKDSARLTEKHEARSKLTLPKRLQLIQIEAKSRRLSFHTEMHSVEREVQRMERRLDNA